jgi:hypothetical protein
VGGLRLTPVPQGPPDVTACATFGLDPYAPITNGKAERFIQTFPRESAYALP